VFALALSLRLAALEGRQSPASGPERAAELPITPVSPASRVLLSNGSGGQAGAMTATSTTETPIIIPILALVVAILAVFFGPIIGRANVQRQIRVATREAWIREFREQVARLLARIQALRHLAGNPESPEGAKRRDELHDALAPAI
jgi:hypothetical protein